MKRLVLVATGLVALLLAVVAVVATGGDPATPVAAQTAQVRVTAGAAGKAPALSGTGFDGSAVEITPGEGRSKLLVFVAHWCPHCRREVPRLVKQLEEQGLPHTYDIYAISTAVDSKRPNYPPSAWLEKEGWLPPVLRDDDAGSAAKAYGLEGFPYFVAIRPDGTIAAKVGGEIDAARFSALVEAAR